MLVPEKTYAAVDLGASSGRLVLGFLNDEGCIELREIHRFDNVQQHRNGHDCWQLDVLFEEIVEGLIKCKQAGYEPISVGIDTWGVDFVLLDENDEIVGDSVAYRDSRTDGIFEVADAIMDPLEVYRITGIQRQPFNTIYQFLALQREHPEQLEAAKTFLMIPDYLGFLLTGKKVNEYTNATTTGLVNAYTTQWDPVLLEKFNIPADIFLPTTMPGAVVGPLRPEIVERIGFETTLILPATHDTGSAYLAVPARDDKAVFLSSGTWSLLGVENFGPIADAASYEGNFTNEGGYEKRYRFLKNIMGLWIIQSIRRELNGVDYVEGKASAEVSEFLPLPPVKSPIGFSDLINLALEAPDFYAEVDVDLDRFLSPSSMIEEIRKCCSETGQPVPSTVGELMRCVYQSLSKSYARTIEQMKELTGKHYTSINIVGGGCQDAYLNQITADNCGLPVFAGPIEGTSLGNLAVQMMLDGIFDGVQDFRDAIARSFSVQRYDPADVSKD